MCSGAAAVCVVIAVGSGRRKEGGDLLVGHVQTQVVGDAPDARGQLLLHPLV